MKHSQIAKTSLSPRAAENIQTLGERIRIARKRRGWTMEQMASKMYVSRLTLARLEKGEPGVSLAVLASALWVLGLEDDLLNVSVPEKDAVGVYHERRRLPKRVRAAHTDELDF
ncbi:helix-turn-helix domain-containing protein [Desulfatibacillum aliphaticivorans]|uniref:helix-turn-helix domain-containing protein n=1 Tax=Desulfatibacillum aliphaticivorans TaxID=218208 RepID=UPI0004805E91|nr:helix-turn-helix transcriptional regulator [Desulfatibacillum aliphaticivorans]